MASLSSDRQFISGIDQHFVRIGSTAADYLVHLIQTCQRGIPEFPQRILLEGTWFPGKTVRRVNQ